MKLIARTPGGTPSPSALFASAFPRLILSFTKAYRPDDCCGRCDGGREYVGGRSFWPCPSYYPRSCQPTLPPPHRYDMACSYRGRLGKEEVRCQGRREPPSLREFCLSITQIQISSPAESRCFTAFPPFPSLPSPSKPVLQLLYGRKPTPASHVLQPLSDLEPTG